MKNYKNVVISRIDDKYFKRGEVVERCCRIRKRKREFNKK